ncbi:SDR family oxidoreductase [Mucilaginibacter sp. ZT4R22]|uniref:SDR family oxidoreductase n=1 Tax=Mucilaginibacter pankratovii TaxID=2772110 RepID=A0ABR7WNV3_9SPHI|nr:SDR family oxidoreductase [Mucilaginibacter pankratovii]MBD1363985.1 SDR family oxidoreductase [Mucilaginibacter pankratovii]
MNNPFSLKGKNILVTGASSGIGKAIAITAAAMDAQLHITARNEQRLNETYNSLTGPGHTTHIADLNIDAETEALVTSVSKLDGVVLSSGIIKTLPFKFINEGELNAIMQTNFTSPVLLLSKLIKSKKLNSGCSIVFISSIGGNFVGAKGNAMYSASKGAINAIQKVLTLELAPQKIRVNNVAPGMVKTEMWENSTTFSAEQIEEDAKRYPLGYGETSDVANAVVYLLSDASKWVTGISLVLDGGFSVQ